MVNDKGLSVLHSDSRWKIIIDMVAENKEMAEKKLNKPLIALLDSIYYADQKYRKQIDEVEAKYGSSSSEFLLLLKNLSQTDSLNTIQVKAILNQYGWLSEDIVGPQGMTTVFLVIQHADLRTQETYLPMVRDAVKQGKAPAPVLALLEDRIALKNGKKQIYGSQIGKNMKTNTYYVLELEDPENVDKRRAEVNLPPLSEYVSYWKINWSVEQYKKNLAEVKAHATINR